MDLDWPEWVKAIRRKKKQPSELTFKDVQNDRLKKLSRYDEEIADQLIESRLSHRQFRTSIEDITARLKGVDPAMITQIYTLEQYSLIIEQNFNLMHQMTIKSAALMRETLTTVIEDAKEARRERDTAYKYVRYMAVMLFFALLYWFWRTYIFSIIGLDFPFV
jgi:hypothetical protein